MFIVDDLLLGIPFLVSVWRAASAAKGNGNHHVMPHALSLGDDTPTGTILNVRGIAKASPETRAALLRVSAQLGIPVDSLATVIALESGWNPAAMNALPAAGLIQITQGARLPGFESADAVRAIASMSAADQLEHIVPAYYSRFGSKVHGADAGMLYMLNFLPAVAGHADATVVGVRPEGFRGQPAGTGPDGETADTKLLDGGQLSLGSVYKQNYGFDHDGKGYFTIGDIVAHVHRIEDEARGQRVDVDGNIVEPLKTAGGCGGNLATFKPSVTGDGLMSYKTAGGCGNMGRLDDDNCGNWGPWSEQYRSTDSTEAVPVKIVGGPSAPPGFEHAREVFVEPEVSWGEVRTAGGAKVNNEQLDIIKRGVVEAVRTGDIEPIRWTQIKVHGADGSDYDLVVMNEPISSHGIRLPSSFDDVVTVSNLLRALPITPAISDARWAAAKRVPAQPLADATGAMDYRTPGGADQVIRYNERMGPNTGEFRDGFWKELVVHPQLTPDGRHSMAQYGMRTNANGTMLQQGYPSDHDRRYADYSNTSTYVSRAARKNGVDIDLLDEYAAGGPLIAALPDWLVARFREQQVA